MKTKKLNMPFLKGSLGALLLLLTSLFTTDAAATHFRYGSIKWTKTPGNDNSIEFTISTAWRTAFYFGSTPSVGAIVSSGQVFNFGQGAAVAFNLTVTSVDASGGWFFAETKLTKVYTGSAANYVAYFESCCRLSNLENSPDGNFRVQTTVNVGGSNESPTTTLPPIVNLQTGQTAATFTIPGADPDGDALTYSLASVAEVGISPLSGFSVSSTGTATFNTVGKVAGDIYTAQVKITDGDAIVFVDFIILIVKVSNPPFFDYTVTPANGHVFKISSGTPLSFTVKASDPDVGATVSLSGTGIPVGASFSPGAPAKPISAGFSWTPTVSQFGVFVVSFTATDNDNAQVLTSVTIQVSNAPVFEVPPTPNDFSYIVAAPGETVLFDVEASDPDPADKVKINKMMGKDNNGVSVVITNALYSGAALSPFPTTAANPTTGDFSWTVSGSQWGERPITFTAEDGFGDKAEHTVHVLVNTTPEFTSTPGENVCVNTLYTYDVASDDPDVTYGDELELHAINVPSWATFTDNGDGTGTLSGTPGPGDVGDYEVTILLEDIYHHQNVPAIPFQTFTIHVLPAPIAYAGGDPTVYYGYSPLACTTLFGSANEGTYPYSYTWSNGATTEGTTVCPTTSTTYTLTATDANGCIATDDATVTVEDVRCGNNLNKVSVCHNGNEICISANAVPAHLAHGGDNLGACSAPSGSVIHVEHGMELTASPNPFNGSAVIHFESSTTSHALVQVFSLNGTLLQTLFDGNVNAGEITDLVVGDKLPLAGVFIVKAVAGEESRVIRIVKN